jgi:hypothetical protein
VVQLQLLLLVELLCELLDFFVLLHVVALGIVHQALRTTIISVRGLSQPLVASLATTPTSRYRSNSSSGSTSQRLVLAAGILPLFLFATTLCSDIYLGLPSVPYLWGRLQMPGVPSCSLVALVCQAEELRDVLHIMCG